MKSGTPFVTAITVQRPRDLDKIVKAIEREAEYAGDSFYYNWSAGGQRIEGPSIGLANSLAREWTNAALTVELSETDEAFYITPRFIDLEKGFQTERVFRQRKNAVQGKYDPDRKLDMALQIGQSKAIRNVVVNAVPRWLVERAIEKAKDAVQRGIDPKKLDEFKTQIEAYFKTRGVTAEQLVAKAGKPMAEWTTRDVADFRGDKKALENGEVTVAELFPPAEPKAPVGPVNDATTAAGTLKAETTREPGSDEGEDPPMTMTPEEIARIKEREIAESKGQAPPAGGAAKPGADKPSKGGSTLFGR
jgi:hypothetical protein